MFDKVHGAMLLWLLLGLCDAARPIGGWRQEASGARPSTVNCTWRSFQQKVDHFGDHRGTFPQRLCIYDKWWRNASASGFKAHGTALGPIFFYTGNESPVDEYVNQTGLMWELAPSMGALLVFAEHRCEPKSHPNFCGVGSQNCVGYCTTAQALADYAAIITDLKQEVDNATVPVVAFGGSYGGMLAGWLRMKMPHIVCGAIAASAPIWQLATTVTQKSLDWPYQAISRGVSPEGGASQHCFDTLRVAWPLLEGGLSSFEGLELLSRRVRSCGMLPTARSFTTWAQEAYFLLAEGNYPFPSTYIPSAVGDGGTLPAWPMRKACEALSQDFGIHVAGSLEDVNYTVTLGELRVEVDWEHLNSNGAQLKASQLQPVLKLAEAVMQSVAVWYNVSGSKQCWDIPEAGLAPGFRSGASEVTAAPTGLCPACPVCDACPACPVSRCAKTTSPCRFDGNVSKTFAWTSIVCNDDLSQVSVRGVGHDFYWPPWPYGLRRNYTVRDVVGPTKPQVGVCGQDLANQGLFGAPNSTDLWSTWLTAYYGGRNISQHRNIIWSNGALDPWSGMGVYPESMGPTGPMVQEINEDGSQIALVLDLGAHHLDLMFSDPQDPPCAAKARKIEADRIHQWCQDMYSQTSVSQAVSEVVVI